MDIFLYISKQQSFFPVFVHCLDWGSSRAHQPAKRTDKINCFCLCSYLVLTFFCPGPCIFSLHLCFSSSGEYRSLTKSLFLLPSSLLTNILQTHTSIRGVSFILFHTKRKLPAMFLSLCLCFNLYFKQAHTHTICCHVVSYNREEKRR